MRRKSIKIFERGISQILDVLNSLRPKSRVASQIIYTRYEAENAHLLVREVIMGQQSVLNRQDYQRKLVQS